MPNCPPDGPSAGEVVGHRLPGALRSGRAVHDGDELVGRRVRFDRGAVGERGAVGGVDEHLGPAVAVEVMDGDVVVVTETADGGGAADRRRSGVVGTVAGDLGVGARSLVDAPQTLPGEGVRLQEVRPVPGARQPADHEFVAAVTVEVTGPGVLHGVSVGVGQGDLRVPLPEVRRTAARLLLAAVHDRAHRIGAVPPPTVVLVRGRGGDRPVVEALPRPVDVEGDVRAVLGTEQSPAEKGAAAGGDRHETPVEVLHDAAGLCFGGPVCVGGRVRGGGGEQAGECGHGTRRRDSATPWTDEGHGRVLEGGKRWLRRSTVRPASRRVDDLPHAATRPQCADHIRRPRNRNRANSRFARRGRSVVPPVRCGSVEAHPPNHRCGSAPQGGQRETEERTCRSRHFPMPR